VGLFKRNKSPAQLSARQLANTLHDAGMTDQGITGALGASRSQVCKIRRGQETGTILRPRLLALVEGSTPAAYKNGQQLKMPARPPHPARQHARSAPAVSVLAATRDLVPHIDTSASDAVGLEGSIDGRQFGWGGPDRRPTQQPPEHVKRAKPARLHVSRPPSPPTRTTIHMPPPVATPGRTDTHTLKRAYDALRESGFSDTEAQHILAPFRDSAQRQRAAPSAEPREPDYMPLLAQAEHELRTGNNAGYWTTADVIECARALARRDASRRQAPRLPDPEVRLLAAPAPRPETAPAPVYRVTQLAWPRRPAQLSLGDSRTAMHEDTTRQVSDSVTGMLRQSTQQAPRPAEVPTIQTPPAVGTPATLGALVSLPDYVVR
jgi:hypothetical protein